MKRRTDTLDAEYRRRGLVRPTQAKKALGLHANANESEVQFAHPLKRNVVERFNWRGTEVWGVLGNEVTVTIEADTSAFVGAMERAGGR